MTEHDRRIQELLAEIVEQRNLWRTWNNPLPRKMAGSRQLLFKLIHDNFLFRYVVRLYAVIELDWQKASNRNNKERTGDEKFSFGIWLDSRNVNASLNGIKQKYDTLLKKDATRVFTIRNTLLAHNPLDMPIIQKVEICDLLSFSETLEMLFAEVVALYPDVRTHWEDNGTSSNFPALKHCMAAEAIPEMFTMLQP